MDDFKGKSLARFPFFILVKRDNFLHVTSFAYYIFIGCSAGEMFDADYFVLIKKGINLAKKDDNISLFPLLA